MSEDNACWPFQKQKRRGMIRAVFINSFQMLIRQLQRLRSP